MVHLSQPAQRHLEEFYSIRRNDLVKDLIYAFKTHNGNDVTDLIRGRIMAIDEILQMKNVFENYETLKKSVEENSKGAN